MMVWKMYFLSIVAILGLYIYIYVRFQGGIWRPPLFIKSLGYIHAMFVHVSCVLILELKDLN